MIAILLLLEPLFFEVIHESYQFIVLKQPDDHKLSTLIRIVLVVFVSIAVAVMEHSFVHFFGCLGFSVCSFALFDPMLNMSRRWFGGRKDIGFFYYGKDAKTDNWMSQIPKALQVFIRLVSLGAGIYLYIKL